MSEPAQSPRYQLLVDHLGTGLTLSYLALVAIGMFHSVLGYRHFGINILDYAEASDFLLAPFRDPMVMVVTVLPAVLAWAYLRFFERYAMRTRERRRAAGKALAWWESSEATLERTKPFMPLLAVGMAMLWVFVSANSYQRILAVQAMRGDGHNVLVELADGTRDGGTPRRPLVMIGATSRYFIFFRTADWRTEVMPTDNVLRILPEGTLPPRSVSRRERSWKLLDARPLPQNGMDSTLGR
ncbi:MAG: hypothetical protein IBJ03_02070 [Gemmatimonadaceae bacterium]|nr:hypothetical protein [Gemmatimonadaceae bacterium]